MGKIGRIDMKLKKFKERDHKRIGIIVFTLVCILLVSGVILYRTFAIFEVRTNQNVINGNVQSMGDLEFAFYKDDQIVKEAPQKSDGYSLDTSSSYCIDLLNNKQVSNVNWDYENWSIEIKNVSTTKAKCYLYFKQIYKEEILNGAIPDLGNGRLVPVQISNNAKPSDVEYINNLKNYGGKVIKADITDKWYSYLDNQWANAVILKDGVPDNYASGQEIPESDIESYFVWIPRYRYQLKDSESTYNNYSDRTSLGVHSNNDTVSNLGLKNPYKIVYETVDSGLSTGTQQNDWLTHPAFVSFHANGMWVGKFETGTTLIENYNVLNSSTIQIKPNTYSWRSIDISHAFYNSYNYLRDLDSHMMKNTEWGAVFYLTYSKYGRCSETECKEVRLNNNGNYITGYSASKDATCGYTASNEECNKYENVKINQDGNYSYNYYNPLSMESSTTGNYSGIYDMSGGAGEFVMGVLQSSLTNRTPTTGNNSTTNSGFNGPYSKMEGEKEDGLPMPQSKYYDLYEFGTTDKNYFLGHLGDATKETGPFYTIQYSYGQNLTQSISSYFADMAYFIYSDFPWFIRNGSISHGSESGISAFLGTRGTTGIGNTFRLVLTP